MKIQINSKGEKYVMSKRRRWMVTSTFVCPECDTEIPLPREHCTQREKGHIKDLYCPKCKKETIINAQDMKVTLAEHK